MPLQEHINQAEEISVTPSVKQSCSNADKTVHTGNEYCYIQKDREFRVHPLRLVFSFNEMLLHSDNSLTD